MNHLPKELVDLIAKNIRDLKSWLNLRLTCKRCWTLCSLEQYRVQFLVQVMKLHPQKCYFKLPNKLKHGEYKEWYKNSQLRALCFYKDGQREGESKTWYENGQISRHRFYKNDRLEGKYKMWYENGQLSMQCCYKDDRREGEFMRWREDGKLLVIHN
jgi:MORN repeat protein